VVVTLWAVCVASRKWTSEWGCSDDNGAINVLGLWGLPCWQVLFLSVRYESKFPAERRATLWTQDSWH
jgi:hypothetical protein